MTHALSQQVGTVSASAAPKWRVLLTDDEPVQRMLIGRMLSRAGYEVVMAEDGQQALQMMQQGEFNLLITDWEMPNLDGIGLCRAVRSINLPHYTYTILLTSRDASEHVVMGLQAGADDYLTKPIIEPELLARLNTGKRLVEMERSLRNALEENRRLSIIDALTGVYNRRYLMEQLVKEVDRSARYHHPLSLMLCDVDHFKRINDTYGHQCGDETLVQFSQTLRGCLRETDWISRYGGEEFVIVLPETNLSAAAQVAERCRAALAKEPLKISNQSLPVTASFGVSGWQEGVPVGAEVSKLIAVADTGVYASKQNGRNRVTVQAQE
ncbi:MAG TPA: diguanylate cyclase [Steroidobacteraceae bacterium]|nr:diguanylate cyclase [Steroidobacteraceae bacterium]